MVPRWTGGSPRGLASSILLGLSFQGLHRKEAGDRGGDRACSQPCKAASCRIGCLGAQTQLGPVLPGSLLPSEQVCCWPHWPAQSWVCRPHTLHLCQRQDCSPPWAYEG